MDNTNYDEFNEEAVGRANVEATPERVQYYKDIDKQNVAALWTVANKIEPWEPKSESVPMVWRYKDLREHVFKSAEIVSPEEAGRRVLYFNNPGRQDHAAAVGLLYAGLQTMHPGEAASAHWHSSSALRFIMEGKGAYTIVNGNKLTLNANDFAITPNGCWHEHGVDEDGEPCIWMDGLDIPLVNVLEAGFYGVHPDLRQAITKPIDASPNMWSGGGLIPTVHDWQEHYSPLFKYEWWRTYEALQNYAKVSDGSPYDGIMMDYINPLTGGPAMSTIGASMQMLRPGEHTKAHRSTGHVLYQCAKGKGYSIINGQRFDWSERDVFCVPSWMFHEHVNLSDTEDACLFSINDYPVMKKLNLYFEEALAENNGNQPILSE